MSVCVPGVTLMLYVLCCSQEVLNLHNWVESANAFSLQFASQGLFGISGSSEPHHSAGLVSLLCMQLTSLAGLLSSLRLSRLYHTYIRTRIHLAGSEAIQDSELKEEL